MIDRFVGYVDMQEVQPGIFQLVRVTDFSNPACPYQAMDIAARMPISRPQAQVFVVTAAEFNRLHKEGAPL